MEVAVPPGNPAHVTSVKNLSKSSVKTALCQPQVPCGFVAKKVFSLNKIHVKPVTLQPDVKSVLTQVELNNVDAGMVYVTDVKAAGKKVKGIKIPAGDNASTSYPIATIKKSTQHDDGAGVRVLRAVAGRPEGARRRRVREAIAAGLEKARGGDHPAERARPGPPGRARRRLPPGPGVTAGTGAGRGGVPGAAADRAW